MIRSSLRPAFARTSSTLHPGWLVGATRRVFLSWLQLASSLLPTLIIGMGMWLRAFLISGYRFHPDEALYATWARLIATGQDVWLAREVVDKPPLNLYMLASLFGTLGASEEIARVPGIVFSSLSIGLVYGIASEVYHDRRVAILASCVFALSPMALLFAPTAFVDGPMLFWVLAAAWAALRASFGMAGLLLGLGMATKQDAVLAAPLLLGMAVWFPHCAGTIRSSIARGSWFVAGVALPLVLIAWWSMARPQPDFLSASLANYGGLNAVPVSEYGDRLLSWVPFILVLTSPIALGLATVTLMGLFVAQSTHLNIGQWVNRVLFVVLPRHSLTAPDASRLEGMTHDDLARGFDRSVTRIDLGIISLCVAWIGIHTILNFQPWDRYMLPLAPVAALMVGRASVFWWDRLKGWIWQWAMVFALGVALALSTRDALANNIHVGRDFDLHAGVDQIGAWFWHTDTTATILYVHDLSWELGYYTFGRVLDRRWFADADDIAVGAAHMPLAQRYVVVAEWEPLLAELHSALARHQLKAKIVFVARRADTSAAAYIFRISPLDMPGEGHAPAPGSAILSFTY